MPMKTATKLRNLKITKVDFVDQGANPDAHITMKKRREEEGASEVNWLERIGKALADALGLKGPEDIEKMAVTFGEEKNKSRVRRVFDNVWWDYTNALRCSIESIITDATLDEAQKSDMINQTLDEFVATMSKTLTNATVQIAIENSIAKAGRKISAERLDRLKANRDELDSIIKEAEGCMDPDPNDPEVDPMMGTEPEADPEVDPEGEDEDMKIDKSKMTPSELAILADLEKRYSTEEPAATPAAVADPVTKSNEIHPEVAAELASLKKFKEDAEHREMVSVAKKYEIIGKDPEELAKKLTELKKSGAYDDYVAVLDEQVGMVEKSGLFSEIGKRGSQSVDSDPWTQIEKKAEEIKKAKPDLTMTEAIDKACQENPDLVDQYEKSRR